MLTDDEGDLAARQVYDAWGNTVSSETLNGGVGRLGYGGEVGYKSDGYGDLNPVTGGIVERQGVPHDPDLGRALQQDDELYGYRGKWTWPFTDPANYPDATEDKVVEGSVKVIVGLELALLSLVGIEWGVNTANTGGSAPGMDKYRAQVRTTGKVCSWVGYIGGVVTAVDGGFEMGTGLGDDIFPPGNPPGSLGAHLFPPSLWDIPVGPAQPVGLPGAPPNPTGLTASWLWTRPQILAQIDDGPR